MEDRLNNGIPDTGEEKRNIFNTGSALEIAAIVCGVVGFALLATGVLAVISGALGVTFFILGNYRSKSHPVTRKTGLFLSLLPLIAGIFITGSAVKEINTGIKEGKIMIIYNEDGSYYFDIDPEFFLGTTDYPNM